MNSNPKFYQLTEAGWSVNMTVANGAHQCTIPKLKCNFVFVKRPSESRITTNLIQPSQIVTDS